MEIRLSFALADSPGAGGQVILIIAKLLQEKGNDVFKKVSLWMIETRHIIHFTSLKIPLFTKEPYKLNKWDYKQIKRLLFEWKQWDVVNFVFKSYSMP